jgi:peroxiredoxin
LANYARHLQPEFSVSPPRLVTVSTADAFHMREFRRSLGAQWPFVCDDQRQLIHELGIADSTDKRYAPVAVPYTFVLDGNLLIHKVYFGWWFVGRPTVEELRQDFRALLAGRATPTAGGPEAVSQPRS